MPCSTTSWSARRMRIPIPVSHASRCGPIKLKYCITAFLITAARCGVDDGIHPLISGSMVVDPEGHIVAENKTEEDEVVWADIDLDACQQGKQKTFCFAKHRRIEHYGPITEQTGVVEPEEPSDV